MPSCDLAEIYHRSKKETQSSPKDSLHRILEFMGGNAHVKSLLFCYLFQINEWYSTDLCGEKLDSLQGYLLRNQEFSRLTQSLND